MLCEAGSGLSQGLTGGGDDWRNSFFLLGLVLALEPPQRVWSRVWVLKHSVKGRDGMYWCLPAQGNAPHREHPTLPQGRGVHSPHPCPALCPELPRANADLSGSGARLAAIGVVCVEMLLFAAGGPSWQVPTALLWDQVGSKAAPSMGRNYRGTL